MGSSISGPHNGPTQRGTSLAQEGNLDDDAKKKNEVKPSSPLFLLSEEDVDGYHEGSLAVGKTAVPSAASNVTARRKLSTCGRRRSSGTTAACKDPSERYMRTPSSPSAAHTKVGMGGVEASASLIDVAFPSCLLSQSAPTSVVVNHNGDDGSAQINMTASSSLSTTERVIKGHCHHHEAAASSTVSLMSSHPKGFSNNTLVQPNTQAAWVERREAKRPRPLSLVGGAAVKASSAAPNTTCTSTQPHFLTSRLSLPSLCPQDDTEKGDGGVEEEMQQRATSRVLQTEESAAIQATDEGSSVLPSSSSELKTSKVVATLRQSIAKGIPPSSSFYSSVTSSPTTTQIKGTLLTRSKDDKEERSREQTVIITMLPNDSLASGKLQSSSTVHCARGEEVGAVGREIGFREKGRDGDKKTSNVVVGVDAAVSFSFSVSEVDRDHMSKADMRAARGENKTDASKPSSFLLAPPPPFSSNSSATAMKGMSSGSSPCSFLYSSSSNMVAGAFTNKCRQSSLAGGLTSFSRSSIATTNLRSSEVGHSASSSPFIRREGTLDVDDEGELTQSEVENRGRNTRERIEEKADVPCESNQTSAIEFNKIGREREAREGSTNSTNGTSTSIFFSMSLSGSPGASLRHRRPKGVDLPPLVGSIRELLSGTKPSAKEVPTCPEAETGQRVEKMKKNVNNEENRPEERRASPLLMSKEEAAVSRAAVVIACGGVPKGSPALPRRQSIVTINDDPLPSRTVANNYSNTTDNVCKAARCGEGDPAQASISATCTAADPFCSSSSSAGAFGPSTQKSREVSSLVPTPTMASTGNSQMYPNNTTDGCYRPQGSDHPTNSSLAETSYYGSPLYPLHAQGQPLASPEISPAKSSSSRVAVGVAQRQQQLESDSATPQLADSSRGGRHLPHRPWLALSFDGGVGDGASSPTFPFHGKGNNIAPSGSVEGDGFSPLQNYKWGRRSTTEIEIKRRSTILSIVAEANENTGEANRCNAMNRVNEEEGYYTCSNPLQATNVHSVRSLNGEKRGKTHEEPTHSNDVYRVDDESGEVVTARQPPPPLTPHSSLTHRQRRAKGLTSSLYGASSSSAHNTHSGSSSSASPSFRQQPNNNTFQLAVKVPPPPLSSGGVLPSQVRVVQLPSSEPPSARAGCSLASPTSTTMMAATVASPTRISERSNKSSRDGLVNASFVPLPLLPIPQALPTTPEGIPLLHNYAGPMCAPLADYTQAVGGEAVHAMESEEVRYRGKAQLASGRRRRKSLPPHELEEDKCNNERNNNDNNNDDDNKNKEMFSIRGGEGLCLDDGASSPVRAGPPTAGSPHFPHLLNTLKSDLGSVCISTTTTGSTPLAKATASGSVVFKSGLSQHRSQRSELTRGGEGTSLSHHPTFVVYGGLPADSEEERGDTHPISNVSSFYAPMAMMMRSVGGTEFSSGTCSSSFLTTNGNINNNSNCCSGTTNESAKKGSTEGNNNNDNGTVPSGGEKVGIITSEGATALAAHADINADLSSLRKEDEGGEEEHNTKSPPPTIVVARAHRASSDGHEAKSEEASTNIRSSTHHHDGGGKHNVPLPPTPPTAPTVVSRGTIEEGQSLHLQRRRKKRRHSRMTLSCSSASSSAQFAQLPPPNQSANRSQSSQTFIASPPPLYFSLLRADEKEAPQLQQRRRQEEESGAGGGGDEEGNPRIRERESYDTSGNAMHMSTSTSILIKGGAADGKTARRVSIVSTLEDSPSQVKRQHQRHGDQQQPPLPLLLHHPLGTHHRQEEHLRLPQTPTNTAKGQCFSFIGIGSRTPPSAATNVGVASADYNPQQQRHQPPSISHLSVVATEALAKAAELDEPMRMPLLPLSPLSSSPSLSPSHPPPPPCPPLGCSVVNPPAPMDSSKLLAKAENSEKHSNNKKVTRRVYACPKGAEQDTTDDDEEESDAFVTIRPRKHERLQQGEGALLDASGEQNACAHGHSHTHAQHAGEGEGEGEEGGGVVGARVIDDVAITWEQIGVFNVLSSSGEDEEG